MPEEKKDAVTRRPLVDPKVWELADAFIQGHISDNRQTIEAELDVPNNLCARLIQNRVDNTWNLAGEIQTTIEDFLNGLES